MYQIMYQIKKPLNLSGFNFVSKALFLSALEEWALLGSNQRPPDYESGALTN
jgi:hypothetical protein